MTQRIATGPCIGCMDYLTATESLHLPILPDVTSTHSAVLSDLLFIIDAPRDFVLPDNDAMIVLFFDRHEQQRELPDNGYQVTSGRPLTTSGLQHWAQAATQLLPIPFLSPGLIGTDPADLRQVLQVCSSRRLELQIIEYQDDDQLPQAALGATRFNNLFACLLGDPEQLTLERCSELGCALEQITPETGSLRIAANFHGESELRVLLLGEVASSTTRERQVSSPSSIDGDFPLPAFLTRR